MNNTNVSYVPEEEKLDDFRRAMEEEREARVRFDRQKAIENKIAGVALIAIAGVCLYIGGELIVGAILGGLFGLAALAN